MEQEQKFEMTCKRCGHVGTDYKVRQNNIHLSADCIECGSFIDHIPQPKNHSSKKIQRLLWAKTNGSCGYCGVNIDPDEPRKKSTDHMIAQSKGGGHDIENLYIACMECNGEKYNKSIEEYRAYIEKKRGKTNHVFWFEIMDRSQLKPKHIAEILNDVLKKIYFNNQK
jgi:hypothetical protein